MKRKPICVKILIMILIMNAMCIPSFASANGSYKSSARGFCIFDGNEYVPMQTYEVNGDRTNWFICAEQLANYGFSVEWDGALRETRITYSGDSSYPKVQFPIKPSGKVYQSDIKVYVNNKELPVFNVGGYSLISAYDFQMIYPLSFWGSMPSPWALPYVLDASYNQIFSFVGESLDFTFAADYNISGKTSIDYQAPIDLSHFSQQLCNFILQAQKKDVAGIYIESPTEYLYNIGIMRGMPINGDMVKWMVTKEEACTMLRNAVNYLNIPIGTVKKTVFNDQQKISNWAVDSMAYLYENQIIGANQNGFVNPKAAISSEQSLVMLDKLGQKYNLFKKMPTYDLATAQSPEAISGRESFPIETLNHPILLPSDPAYLFNRYLCGLEVSSSHLYIDQTAGFWLSNSVHLAYRPIGWADAYSKEKIVAGNGVDGSVYDYFGNGIVRTAIPLTNKEIDRLVLYIMNTSPDTGKEITQYCEIAKTGIKIIP